MINLNNKSKSKNLGFTLIELMVSISIFSIVILVSLGSIMSVLDANKKSQTLRAVMDNLNFSLESMTRDIRFGENYHCGTSGTLTDPQDCSNNITGDSTLNFKSADTGLQVTYKYNSSIKRIIKTSGGVDYYVTSPDVKIESLTFRVYGSPTYFGGTSNTVQPKVVILITGYAGTKITTKSSFILETTVSQRKLDL
jgi:prepilin-type N-terminal cleavage/methylation domain-containing protein